MKDSNPTERFPVVTVLLIALNILVFLYQLALGEAGAEHVIGAFALVPARIFHSVTAVPGPLPVGVTLFTSQFLHGGLFHLAGNMLFLWIFVNKVEDAMVSKRNLKTGSPSYSRKRSGFGSKLGWTIPILTSASGSIQWRLSLIVKPEAKNRFGE